MKKLTTLCFFAGLLLIFQPAFTQNKKHAVGPLGSSQIKNLTSGTIICSNGYSPSSTITLNFSHTFASPDYEYLDGLTMTFPAGIVPNTSGTSNPLTTANGCTGVTIPLVSVSGQTVTWGEVVTPTTCGALVPGTYNFSVNVTVAGGVSGTQSVAFTLYGDGYGSAPHTVTGNCQITQSLALDAATQSIDMNGFVPMGTPYSPKATVLNNGSGTISFNVTMNITPGGYTSTQTVSSLAPGATQQVVFTPDWNPAVSGSYNVTVFTSLAGDLNHANDTLRKPVFTALLPHARAFAYNAYDPVGSEGPAKTFTDQPGSVTLIQSQSGAFAAGGAWINNQWYAALYDTNMLITIDTATGSRTIIGNIGKTLNAMAYDYTSSVLYGLSYDGTNTQLNTINPSTAAATLVGNVTSGILVAMGCDHLGNLYGVNLSDDNLYFINKGTGAGTIVGPLGYDAGYAQGMDYDFYTGQMFIFAYNSGVTPQTGQMRICNLSTGSSFLIGDFLNNSELDAPVFVNSCKTDAWFRPDTVCPGLPTHFTDLSTGVTVAGQYRWDVNNDGVVDYTTRGNITHTYPAAGTYTCKLKIVDAFCSDSILVQVLVDPCTGVSENQILATPQIYPNPGQGRFTLAFEDGNQGRVAVRITDLTGREIYNTQIILSGGPAKSEIDLRGVTPGIYLIHLLMNNQLHTYKLIVQ